jgi:hydrogenase maturation protease
MAMVRRRDRLLVLGIGNVLMSDDGVGVFAVEELRKQPRAGGVLITEVGTAIFEAVALLARADRVLVIDAFRAGGVPGTIYQVGSGDLLREPTRLALHEMDLMGALELLPPGQRPQEISMLGVEPECLEPGLGLSPTVAAVLPSLVRIVNDTVAEWRNHEALPAYTAGGLAKTGASPWD